MSQTSAATNVFDDPSARRGGWATWIVPVILLVLVPVLIAIAVFSHQSLSVWSVTDIVLFILTALLCTLVAASLALTACRQGLTHIEQSIHATVAQIDALQDAQVRLGETVHKSHSETHAKTLHGEENQRSLQEGMARLADLVQTVTAKVTTLGATLQTHQEATDTALAALAASQGQFSGEVRQLHELTRTVANTTTDAAREQAAIRDVLQDSAKAVTTVIEAIHQGQDSLQTRLDTIAEGGRQTSVVITAAVDVVHQDLNGLQMKLDGVAGTARQTSEAVAAAATAVHQGQDALRTRLEGVVETTRQTFEAVNGTSAAVQRGQDTLGTKLESIADAGRQTIATLTGVAEALHRHQDILGTKLENMAEAGRQTIAAVTAMAGEQKTAQETVKRMVEEVTGLGTTQVPFGEALRAHGDVINMAVAALAASEERLTHDVRQLHEFTRTLAGGMTDVAREQATAHTSLQQVLTGTTELIHQGHSTVQTKLEDIAGTGRQTIEAVTGIAAEQRTAHAAIAETLQAQRDAVNTGIAALTNGQGQLTGDVRRLQELTQTVAGSVSDAAREQAAAHGTLQQTLTGTTEVIHQARNALQVKLEEVAGTGRQTIEAVTTMAAGQTALHETARHVMEEVTGVATRQTAFGEALQAHGEATNTGIGALTSGQGQLTGDVRQLHELTQTVAGGVTDAVREQATAHSALLAATADAIQQSQRTLRIELEKLAQSAAQTIEAVNAVAAGQTTGREATRRVIGELANAAITALSTGHAPLPRMDRPLEALVQTVAGGGPLNIELPPPAGEAVVSPRLPAVQAIIHGEQMRYESGPDRDNLGCWANPNDWAEWQLDVTRPGRFKVTAEIAALASGRFQIVLGDQGLAGNAPSTGDYGRFEKVEIGTVELPAPGKTSVAVRPIPEGWQPMNLKSVELVPLA